MVTPIEDLTRKQERLLGRYQLNSMLGREGRAARLAKRLGNRGIDDISGTINQFENPRSLADDALARMSRQGALGGKEAKRLETLLDIESWGTSARTSGLDDIAGMYGSFNQNLGATLGEFDQFDPALASIISGGVEGRMEDTSRFLSNVEQQKSQARIDYLAPILDETGALVEALKRLEEQEDDLRSAQRGSLYSGFLNPVRGLGGLVGGAVGGPQGAFAGSQSAYDAVGENAAMIESILGILGKAKTV